MTLVQSAPGLLIADCGDREFPLPAAAVPTPEEIRDVKLSVPPRATACGLPGIVGDRETGAASPGRAGGEGHADAAGGAGRQRGRAERARVRLGVVPRVRPTQADAFDRQAGGRLGQ